MRSGGAYDLASSPKYLVILAGAGHLAWTDVRHEGHENIMAYTLSFLDHYVRGAGATTQLTSGIGLSEYRYSSELGNRP
jgi:hypothetical protein